VEHAKRHSIWILFLGSADPVWILSCPKDLKQKNLLKQVLGGCFANKLEAKLLNYIYMLKNDYIKKKNPRAASTCGSSGHSIPTLQSPSTPVQSPCHRLSLMSEDHEVKLKVATRPRCLGIFMAVGRMDADFFFGRGYLQLDLGLL